MQLASRHAISLTCSMRDRIGLNILNFFVPEVVAVALPFIGDYLKEAHWEYKTIGTALAMSSLGALLCQIPAGLISDRIERKRWLLASAVGILGLAYFILPTCVKSHQTVSAPGLIEQLQVCGILLIGGAASAFFAPLLSSLALSRVSPKNLASILGENQAWGHFGNIAVACGIFQAIPLLGTGSLFLIFAGVAFSSLFGLLIMSPTAKPGSLFISTQTVEQPNQVNRQREALNLRSLLAHPKTALFLLSTFLFHVSNAPVIPLVALHLRELGGTQRDLSLLVLTSQFVMVFASAGLGFLIHYLSIYSLYRFVFFILTIRTALYPLLENFKGFIALQVLDGIGNGFYGVLVVLICQKLGQPTGTFNAWIGLMATLLGLGGVLGALFLGALAQEWGILPSYFILASCGLCALLLFGKPEAAHCNSTRASDPYP